MNLTLSKLRSENAAIKLVTCILLIGTTFTLRVKCNIVLQFLYQYASCLSYGLNVAQPYNFETSSADKLAQRLSKKYLFIGIIMAEYYKKVKSVSLICKYVKLWILRMLSYWHPELFFSTTFLKNCGRGESLWTTTCLRTVFGGKQGHAPCKFLLSLLLHIYIQF